jgi:small acid-soluble spore protein (thioredoxin-like protein)
MDNHAQNNSGEHREKINKMEEMINDTLENVNEAEDALDDAKTGAQVENIKEKNAKRLESVDNFRREIEEESSLI